MKQKKAGRKKGLKEERTKERQLKRGANYEKKKQKEKSEMCQLETV